MLRPEEMGARRQRLGDDVLEAADPAARSLAHLQRDLRLPGRDRVVVLGLEPQDPRTLDRAVTRRERRAERDRHLAEDVAGMAVAEDALDAVEELDDLEVPVEHGEERPLVALGDCVLARLDMDVRRCLGDSAKLFLRQLGEERNGGDLVCGHHRPTPAP